MESRNYPEWIKGLVAAFGHLPLVIFLQTLYFINYSLFIDLAVFPDTTYYQSMSVSLRQGRGVEDWINAPFRSRVIYPYLTGILHNLLNLDPYNTTFMTEEWYLFATNVIIMIFVNIALYVLFKEYTNDKLAILGVWVHNLSYPVVWYFLAGLTDALGYLFILLGLLILKKRIQWNKTDIPYFLLIAIGIGVRESVVLTVPLYIYFSYNHFKEDWDNRQVSQPISNLLIEFRKYIFSGITLVILGIMYLMWYGFGGKTNVHAPFHIWLIAIFLSLIPFAPFVFSWHMNNEDKLYSVFVFLYSLYALFFAAFDGRFLALGYPIWVAYNLQVIERLYYWIQNERERL
jgi:hypothetical protein